MKAALVLALSVALLGGLVLARTTSRAAPVAPGSGLRHVRTVDVTREVVAPPVRAAAVLAGRREVPLAFKVGGVVRSVAVREGERVRAGQLLAEIDPAEIRAHVDQARTARDKAARDLGRVEELRRGGVTTASQDEDAHTAFEAADAALRAVTFDEQHASIVATSAGRVLRRMAEPGQLIDAGKPVLDILEDREGWVARAGLADRDAVRARIGDAAQVSVDAYPDTPFSGRVTEVPAALARGAGVAEVEITLDLAADAPRLLSGMPAKVSLRPAGLKPAPVVPLDSLVEADGQSASLFVLGPDGATVQRRAVRISGLNEAGKVALSEGPEVGTRVVTDGAAWLRDGERVVVVDSINLN